MAETEENPGASGTGDEIKPYKVHVSSSFLFLFPARPVAAGMIVHSC